MLQFIFGLPHSGKTDTYLKIINEASLQQKQSVIIVPEQASFETEKTILKEMGDSFSLWVNVLSFSRLHDEISRKIGGISSKVLTDSDKIIFMSKAIKQTARELKVWGKYVKSLTFAKTILDTIGEFKINGISASELENTELLADTQGLRDKLHDLALIYKTYDLLTAERFIDPADNLTKLYYNLENHKYFEGKTVVIDGFKGFTGQQFKIIDRILAQAENVYISFTNNPAAAREFDVFTNVRSAVLKIEKIAKAHSVKILNPIVLNKSNFENQNLALVEKLLSDNSVESNSCDGVFVCEAKTIFDEAEFAARTIRKLVRTENYRFKDFVIISRDSEKYAQAVEYACQKNKINCFFDKKISMLSFPLSIAALSAIKAINFSTENILQFHKSGIGVLTADEISKLENYTYLWNINGDIWDKEWDMDVRGFVTDAPDEKLTSELFHINNLRKKAIKPLLHFKENFIGDAKALSTAIIKLFDECSAITALKNLANTPHFVGFSADFLKQGYDKFILILENIVNCYGTQSVSKSEFYDTLNLALSLENVGIIPQTIDQVVFGQADRIRPQNPKIAFILGANQGEFPKFSNNSGVFAVKERKNLINLGLQIADNEIYSSIDENFLVYSNLCCPTEKLYISYSAQTLKGEELSPAAFVSSILNNLNPAVYYEPEKTLCDNNLPETIDSAYSEYCRRFSQNNNAQTLKTALSNDNLKLIQKLNDKPKSISRENAQKLYGKDIYMSATKFDTFNRCKYSFFCKYGLRLQKLQPADFDVLQRGTIVHYVLEKIISTHKEKIKDFSREKCAQLCDFYINEYLDSVIGYRSIANSRHEFLISKISRSLKEVVWHLAKEFAQSDFKPTHCELKIGGKDGLPLNFEYSEGKIILNGSIDRVDEYNGYIRIVDYKTGTKSFKLPDILFGLNLQMLIYLYAIIRGQGLPDEKAAGIFYMPSKRDLNNEGMAMNGLLQNNFELHKAMEKANGGEFVPALSLNKDGSLPKSATSFITDKEFGKIFDHIENLMKRTGNSIADGQIEINPIDGRESAACTYCDFKSVCRKENDLVFKVPNFKNSEVFEIIEEGDNNGF